MVRRRTIGLLLRDDSITACLLVGAKCAETRHVIGGNDQSFIQLTESVKALRSEWRVHHARVLLGLASIQLRTVDGLPHTRDARVIEHIVATNPFRYFLRRTDRPVVSHAIIEQPGVATMALLDGVLVESVVRSVRASGLVVDAVAVPREYAAAATQTVVGGDGVDRMWRGALQVSPSAWGGDEHSGAPWWRVRREAAAIAAACVIGAALHPVWQLFQLRQHEHKSETSQQATRLAARRMVAIDSLRIPLERLHAAAAASVHPLGVLDMVSTVLSDEGRIVAFDVDTARVEATVSTPSLELFLHRLERDPRVTDLALVGGISHDTSTADAAEGAVVRFRFRDAGGAR